MKKAPSFLRSLMLLCVVDVALRTIGFARVNRVAARIGATGTRTDDVAAVMRQVIRATAMYPGRSLCLEQSVAAMFLLRRRGVDARVRLGVQHYPFAAHAWVEIDGVAVTETEEVVNRFVRLPEVAA
ncbi:MAG TPA: lasso peptide biosynthesis B2 protein [Longimicrobiales bacterium]|nr:lasso peptide biosynthesis B2 protein [Longimicrobiales bacterium]